MIAGSVVARGDFRLKKLLPALEQAGKQAPVFAKVAEAARAVIEGPEESSAASLLELTSLVNAILYTQGETGLAGKVKLVETTDLGGTIVQTNARVLKPLLEALSSTGSGRLELVKEAQQRGHFRDLRLVKPALGALDDPYAEIADLMTEKVLPTYGKAILPELHAKYDPKGTKGHPRRLKLMHTLDPKGTRDLVKQALDEGSKEVKVVAISCLGDDPNDLPYLIEQAGAKAKEVRAAAFEALTAIHKPEAVAVFQKGITSKDYGLVANAIHNGKNPKLVEILVAEIRTGVDALLKLKDKKQVSSQAERLVRLINSFPSGGHPAADALLLDLFARREELAKIKGGTYSGADVVEAVIQQMADGSKASKQAIVKVHAEVPTDQLGYVFDAARDVLTPAQLYDTFAPYLTAKVDEKKKAKDPAWARREAIIESIEEMSDFYWWYRDEDTEEEDQKLPEYDPRWLDLAVGLKRLELVDALAQPGHPGALAFAKAQFDAGMKKAKSPDDVRNELALLLRLRHPDMIDAFIAALSKRGKKRYFYHYWYTRLIPRLPKEAIPHLEKLVATFPENEMDYWLEAIHELRSKT
jgi:HEAT repeat protein